MPSTGKSKSATGADVASDVASFQIAVWSWEALCKKLRYWELYEDAQRIALQLDFADYLKKRGWPPDNDDNWDSEQLKQEFIRELYPEAVENSEGEITWGGMLVPVLGEERLGARVETLDPEREYEVLTRNVVLHRGYRLAERLASTGVSARNLLAFQRDFSRNPAEIPKVWHELELDLDVLALRLKYGSPLGSGAADSGKRTLVRRDGVPPSPPPAAANTRPQWCRPSRVLIIDNQPIPIANREAPVQFAILDALEDAGWPADGVSAPKSGSIKDAVEALNETLASTPIQLLKLNGNQRIGWRTNPT